MVPDIQPLILHRFFHCFCPSWTPLHHLLSSSLSSLQRFLPDSSIWPPPPLISPLQLFPLFLNCLLTLFTHSFIQQIVLESCCVPDPEPVSRTPKLNWGWSQPQGANKIIAQNCSCPGLSVVTELSTELPEKPGVESFSLPWAAWDPTFREGMQFRKPGLSLSNWLHLFLSPNSGDGPEGMNGEEGPTHCKEATWGGPS